MSKGSLVSHHQTQHGMKKGRFGQEGDEASTDDKPMTYRMTFTAKDGTRP